MLGHLRDLVVDLVGKMVHVGTVSYVRQVGWTLEHQATFPLWVPCLGVLQSFVKTHSCLIITVAALGAGRRETGRGPDMLVTLRGER